MPVAERLWSDVKSGGVLQEPTGPPCSVAVVVTESCASTLGVTHELRHLQDLGENWCRSLVSLPRPSFSGTAQLFAVFVRRVPMDLEDVSASSSTKSLTEDHGDVLEETAAATVVDAVLQVRSAAHDGRLITSAGCSRLLVRVVDDTAVHSSCTSWCNICRICHGGDSGERLVAPCRCRGSVALAHMSCLERWLRECGGHHCELCRASFTIVRAPLYTRTHALFHWMRSMPARNLLLMDLAALCVYTPSALAATYALALLCDGIHTNQSTPSAHFVVFATVAGMAAIDFLYTSWLMERVQDHVSHFMQWSNDNCRLTVVLPPRKRPKPKKETLPTYPEPATSTNV